MQIKELDTLQRKLTKLRLPPLTPKPITTNSSTPSTVALAETRSYATLHVPDSLTTDPLEMSSQKVRAMIANGKVLTPSDAYLKKHLTR